MGIDARRFLGYPEGRETKRLKDLWAGHESLPQLTQTRMVLDHLMRAVKLVWSSPGSVVLTVGTIVVVLFLLGAFVLLAQNLGAAAQGVESTLGVSVYLKDGTSPTRVQELLAATRAMPEVAGVSLRSKQEALAVMRKSLGEQGSFLDGLADTDNPLPASLEIKLQSEAISEENLRSLADKFRAESVVEEVQYSHALVHDLSELISLLRRIGLGALLLLHAIVIFIIANTVRLALISRADEIDIMQLVGAGDNFVRLPFVVEGVLHGALGGGVAAVLLALFSTRAQELVSSRSTLRMLFPAFEGLSLGVLILVVILGILVGGVASWCTVQRYLRRTWAPA